MFHYANKRKSEKRESPKEVQFAWENEVSVLLKLFIYGNKNCHPNGARSV